MFGADLMPFVDKPRPDMSKPKSVGGMNRKSTMACWKVLRAQHKFGPGRSRCFMLMILLVSDRTIAILFLCTQGMLNTSMTDPGITMQPKRNFVSIPTARTGICRDRSTIAETSLNTDGTLKLSSAAKIIRVRVRIWNIYLAN